MPRVYVRSPFMLNYLSPCYTAQDTRQYFGKVRTPRHDHAVTITHVAPTTGHAANAHAVAVIKARAAEQIMQESASLFPEIEGTPWLSADKIARRGM